jgi:putative SOS response-associated peptidase YedK
MPGRYFFFSSPETAAAHFGVEIKEPFPPRYNIFPTHPIAIIRQGLKGREFALARWGFIPSWQKKVDGRPQTNARSETVHEKRMFRSAFKRRRCLIPANGYYDWIPDDALRRPHCIRPANDEVLAFAGVWETAIDSDGGEIDTVATLTADPGPNLKSFEREFCVIQPKDYAAWLETDERDAESLIALLGPSTRGFWRHYVVDKKVNSGRRGGAELVAPVRES